jgi:RNA polymerase sigma factor (sigma-70 family)
VAAVAERVSVSDGEIRTPPGFHNTGLRRDCLFGFRFGGCHTAAMLDDATLLRRYADTRAEDAFAEVVRRHIGAVYSAALRRVGGDAHLAEDVVQRVFIALACKATVLSRHPFLTSWLYVSTRNEAANVVRSERRRKAREQEAHAMQEISSTQPVEPDWSRVGPVLDEVIDELSENDRTAVLLRFVDQRAYAEIGAALRLREDAARMRVERALDKLRVRLARRGITSTAAALGVVLSNHAVLAVPAGLVTTVTSTAIAAGGAGGASLGLASIVFMSTTQKAAVIAGVLALFAAGGALYQHQIAGRVRAEREVAIRQLAALERDYQASMGKAVALKAETGRIQNLNDSGPPVPALSTTQSLTHAIEAEQMRLFLATEWGKLAAGALPLIEKLGVSPEQMARYSALADRELEGTYLPGPMAIQRHLATLREKWESETRTLIGDERFGRLKELQTAQTSLGPIANYLDHWDVSLTGHQAGQMLELFAANQAAIQRGGGPLPEALMLQARQILTSAQLEFLNRYKQLAETQRLLTERFKAQDAAAATNRSGG